MPVKKEEKRHFKLLTSTNGSKGDKYLAIFNYLDKQKELNVNDYKKKLSHIKRLSSAQTYLYQLLLKNLQMLHHDENTIVSIDAEAIYPSSKHPLVKKQSIFHKGHSKETRDKLEPML